MERRPSHHPTRAELIPVRAKLCNDPAGWKWSSIHAHLGGFDDKLVTVKPMLDRIADWSSYLEEENSSVEMDTIRKHARTGRPIQGESFLARIENETGMDLRKRKPGPKRVIK